MNLTTHPIDLQPERTLGTPPDLDALHGRLSFGWDCLPVSEGIAPAEWVAYAAAAPDRELRHLVLVCSFHPESPDARGEFVRASLGLSLRTLAADGPPPNGSGPQHDDPRPIARAIEPGERTVPGAAAQSKITLEVKAGLMNIQAERQSPDPAPAHHEWIVRGHGAGQPKPMWQFRRVRKYPLVGDHHVAALVQTVPGRVNLADVLLAAEVEHHTFGIRRYRARLTPALSTITVSDPQAG